MTNTTTNVMACVPLRKEATKKKNGCMYGWVTKKGRWLKEPLEPPPFPTGRDQLGSLQRIRVSADMFQDLWR